MAPTNHPVDSDDSPNAGVDQVILQGSPFADGSHARRSFATKPAKIESVYDVGPLRYTAMGAVAASIMVLGFAGIGVWWFPPGGALVASLGCLLSIFGTFSHFRKVSISLLVVHLALFVVSYSRSFV